MDEFENEILEPIPEKPRKKKKRKISGVGIAILVICLCVLLSNLSRCGKSTAEDMYVFENGANYHITQYDGKVMAVSYDGIRFLNMDGTESSFTELHMSSPHMDIAGKMILMYDKGSNNLAVYDGANKRYSYKCDRPIKSARINTSGSVVLITDEVAYNSRVTVLDGKGKEAYIWKIGDEYIVDADISPDGKRIAAATINTTTGIIVENIVFVDIQKAEETGRAQNEGSMPLKVNFTESGNAVVVSDTKIAAYNYKADKKWENSFENNLLDNFTVDDQGNTVVALRGIKNNSVIRIFTKNGSNSGEFITETQVLHMDLNQKNIAICEKNKVSLINFSGNTLGDIEIKKEINGISVVNDDKIVILCDESIQLLNI